MHKKPSRLLLLSIMASAFALTQSGTACYAESKDHCMIESSVVIKAPARLVFEGIQMSRSTDLERRHMVSHHQDTAVIDENLHGLPVIGTAHLVYKEIEVPFKRIDYLLVSSDKFKAFEGSWELIPLDNGKETKVLLKSYSDLKIFVPFSRNLSASSTLKDINRRLSNLKHWCDQQEGHETHRIAENHLHAKVHAEQEEAASAAQEHN